MNSNTAESRKRILSVVVDRALGLCIEFGDAADDDEVYGFSPSREFLEALRKECQRCEASTVGAGDANGMLMKVRGFLEHLDEGQIDE